MSPKFNIVMQFITIAATNDRMIVSVIIRLQLSRNSCCQMVQFGGGGGGGLARPPPSWAAPQERYEKE